MAMSCHLRLLRSMSGANKGIFFVKTSYCQFISSDIGKNSEEKNGIETVSNFSHTKSTYKSKTTGELLRSYILFKLFQYDKLVDNSHKLFDLGRRILGQRIFEKLLKASIYAQFVAGEDENEVKSSLSKFRSQHLRPMLAYAVEDDTSSGGKDGALEENNDEEMEALYDLNTERTIQCIELAGDTSVNNDAVAAFKLTAITPLSLLIHLSEVLVAADKVFMNLADEPSLLGHITSKSCKEALERKTEVDLTEHDISRLLTITEAKPFGKLNRFSWIKEYIFNTNKWSLLDKQMKQMTSVINRVERLAECAQEKSVRLMVDAEQTYYQPAIRHIAVNVLMPKYNQSRPVIYNTQQCYLKDAFNTVSLDLATAKAEGFLLGVKTVRGAYIAQERQLAKDHGYEDPIWPVKEDTDSSYHRVLDKVLESVKEGKAYSFVATHNEKTVRFALGRMLQSGLDKSNGCVLFGQQLGMSDHISLTLGSHGYMCYKYMPYGPVMEVIPYLIRRAIENKGVLAGAVHERKMLGKEIRQRLFGRR